MVDSATLLSADPQLKQPRNPISRKQVENVMSRSVAVFGIVFGAQTIPMLIGQLDEASPVWLWIVVPALFGSLLVVLLLSIARPWVRYAHGGFAGVYFLALVSWPLAVLPGVEIFNGIHWLNYLLTVATATAAIAFSTFVAGVYLFLAPTIYLIVRITPEGGGAHWELATLEAIYALILGSAIMIIVTMLRQAASDVDNAQAAALERYSHAVRQHATEVERVQVDSIVHDSVLTTLISAARAYSPEAMALSARMAESAIGHLRDAALVSPVDGTTVSLNTISARIADAATALAGPIEVRVGRMGAGCVPAQAAEAVHAATVQAMVNSLQHAGDAGVSRWVAVRGLAPDGIEVVVGDTGDGFDLANGATERLGVRISIIERLANAGGRAVIASAPGAGTLVTIRWPHRVRVDQSAVHDDEEMP